MSKKLMIYLSLFIAILWGGAYIREVTGIVTTWAELPAFFTWVLCLTFTGMKAFCAYEEDYL